MAREKCEFPECPNRRQRHLRGIEVLLYAMVLAMHGALDPVYAFRSGPRSDAGAVPFSEHCRANFERLGDLAELRTCLAHEMQEERERAARYTKLVTAAEQKVATPSQLERARVLATRACLSNPSWWAHPAHKRWVHLFFHTHVWDRVAMLYGVVLPLAVREAASAGKSLPADEPSRLLSFAAFGARVFGGHTFELIQFLTTVERHAAGSHVVPWLRPLSWFVGTTFKWNPSLRQMAQLQVPGPGGEVSRRTWLVCGLH